MRQYSIGNTLPRFNHISISIFYIPINNFKRLKLKPFFKMKLLLTVWTDQSSLFTWKKKTYGTIKTNTIMSTKRNNRILNPLLIFCHLMDRNEHIEKDVNRHCRGSAGQSLFLTELHRLDFRL